MGIHPVSLRGRLRMLKKTGAPALEPPTRGELSGLDRVCALELRLSKADHQWAHTCGGSLRR